MSVKIEIFTSQDCPYCNSAIELVKSVIEEMGKELRNIAKIEVMDVKKHPSKALKYGIYAVPSIVINGSVEFVGRPEKESLLNAIKKEL
ncbi:MAG: MJ0307 family thioredoxin [Candidatus Hydrothermarchaeota archaeon]